MPSKKIVSRGGGFGDSKVFGGSPRNRAPGEIDLDTCHVAGMLVSELPESARTRILYQQTDEGIIWWEENRKRLENTEGKNPSNRSGRLPSGEVARDPDDKKIIQHGDERRSTQELVIDPLAELMRAYTPPGHRGLMMGKRKTSQDGMYRNGVEYVAVMKPDGRPAALGDMFLASAPIAAVEAGEQRQRLIASGALAEAEERTRDNAEKVLGRGGIEEQARRRRLLDSVTGLVEDNPDVAERELARDFDLDSVEV